MQNAIKNVRKSLLKTLSGQAYNQIKDDIIQGHLPPGSKLKIEPLKARYNIGASPLREALNRLYSEGFVTTHGQQGFNVRQVSIKDLDDVTNLRILIENEALTQSIISGDDLWESNLVASFHRLSKIEASTGTKDVYEIEVGNNSFHNALLAACNSTRLHQFYDTLYDQHKRYRNFARGVIPYERDIHEEHTALYNAALEKNITKATEANEYHIRQTADVVKHLKSDEWDV